MKSKVMSAAARYLGTVVCCTLVVTALFFLWRGVPVFGVPDEKEIVSVTVSHTRYCPEGKTVTDSEQIHLAHNLANFLNRDLFATPQEDEVPVVSITCTLRDGSTHTAAAGMHTGWWNGKPRALKEPEMFVNLAEGIFFMPEIMEEEPDAAQGG